MNQLGQNNIGMIDTEHAFIANQINDEINKKMTGLITQTVFEK